MDRLLIKTLIDALEGSALSELEYASGGETLRLVKGATSAAVPTSTAVRQAAAPVAVPAEPPARLAAPAAQDGTVAAPLYGVVHLQPAPGSPAFVAVGQAVDAGQVVCTVEAMKVFTEVRAARAGTVDAILVSDGQEVEPGQALVRIA